MPLSEVRDLRKCYGDLEVLRDVNRPLETGECHALVMNAVSPGYTVAVFHVAPVLTRPLLS